MPAGVLQRAQHMLHAGVKEIGHQTSSRCNVCNMFKFGCRQIPKKNLALAGWFASNAFWQVSQSKVDRICGFVTKGCELSLVRGDDYWHNGGVSLLRGMLNFVL